VFAVKRGMVAMGATGAGGMILTGPAKRRAGTTFVDVLHGIQRRHGLAADGKYGPASHAVIAPHFDLYGVSLYKAAAIRTHTPPAPPIWSENAVTAAKALLKLAAAGDYRADNPGDLRDIRATADGKPVWSRLGKYVYIDPRPLELIHWLIAVHGLRIGTFALCSDHHDDGPHGHAGGLAVDISSINGISISAAGTQAHQQTLAVAKLCRAAGKTPRQLICAGSGYVYYADIEACCIPNAAFYGQTTLSQHRNHIHCGFGP
jgi:hypothetical protein